MSSKIISCRVPEGSQGGPRGFRLPKLVRKAFLKILWGPFWRSFGPSWGPFGPSKAYPPPPFRASRARPGTVLGPSWDFLRRLGSIEVCLGTSVSR